MRYFLDTEFNGFGGELISLALVPEFGDQEYYAVLPFETPPHKWVAANVMPYLGSVPPGLDPRPVPPEQAARAVGQYLAGDTDPVIVADWPDDIAYFCRLLVTGPGEKVFIARIGFDLISLPGFSPSQNSKVPHNALHDARSLRDHLLQWDALA